MLIVVDPHSGVPVYRQVMDQIRFHISSGVLGAGDELPSTRTLSQQLGVNPMTISKAYSFLERDGVIERRPGLPLVVSEFGQSESVDRKVEQLRENLAPSVTAARQLGIGPAEAARIFTDMFGRSLETPPEKIEDDTEEESS